MPHTIEQEITIAKELLSTAAGSQAENKEGGSIQTNAMSHLFNYEQGKVSRVTIFINDNESLIQQDKVRREQTNSYHANLDLIGENLIEMAVGYLGDHIAPEMKIVMIEALRVKIQELAQSSHGALDKNVVDHKKVFNHFKKATKEAIKHYVQIHVKGVVWDTDKFYDWAAHHRPATEIVVITHNNGTISHIGYQSGTSNSAHSKGDPDAPPNSTSYFEYLVNAEDKPVLINCGHTIASPAPKKGDKTAVIMGNLNTAVASYLSVARALDPAKQFPKETHAFHVLLTTPQATGINDGQWDSWVVEQKAITERPTYPTTQQNKSAEGAGEEKSAGPIIHHHVISSGVNNRWGSDALGYYQSIVDANQPVFKALIELLNKHHDENKVSLIAAIEKFTDPNNPLFYMKNAGNALRLNQILSKACNLTDSIYIVGCKSGNDRTYLQRMFNAAANGSPHPGVLAITNTVIDNTGTPKGENTKFSSAIEGFQQAVDEATADGGVTFHTSVKTKEKGVSVPAPSKSSTQSFAEIATPKNLARSAENSKFYQQLGSAHHKSDRGVLTSWGKSAKVTIFGHKATKEPESPSSILNRELIAKLTTELTDKESGSARDRKKAVVLKEALAVMRNEDGHNNETLRTVMRDEQNKGWEKGKGGLGTSTAQSLIDQVLAVKSQNAPSSSNGSVSSSRR